MFVGFQPITNLFSGRDGADIVFLFDQAESISEEEYAVLTVSLVTLFSATLTT